MDSPQRPTPEEARARLDEAADSRRALAEATRRGWWIDAAMAATVGLGVGLGLAGWVLAALAVLVVGALVVTLAQRRTARSHGQILDERAIGARALRFGALYLVLFLLLQFGDAAWQPWYALGTGLAAALGSFAWLRWEDRYRTRRLAAGDFGRHDLV